MKYFLKLNVVSALYAFVLFIAIELMVNVYRISRVTGWEVGNVNNAILLPYFIISFAIGSFGYIFVILRWFEVRKANYWSTILWVPYLILFVAAFAFLFPITDRGDAPNPASGLVIMGLLATYPFYLAIIQVIADQMRET